MADARDFLFNSDYAQDQIVYFKEVEITGKTTYYLETIAHELDFTPLVFGVWDNSPDFNNPKSINTSGKDIYVNDVGNIAYSNQVWAYSDPTNITILVQPKIQGGSGVATNFYIRLYAFEPPASHATVKPTANHASKFIFNTKYNYLKLMEQNTADADYGQVTIPHKLGYIPQVLAWVEKSNNGQIFYVDSATGDFLSADELVKVTTSNVYLNRINSDPTRYYYRIYYDEA